MYLLYHVFIILEYLNHKFKYKFQITISLLLFLLFLQNKMIFICDSTIIRDK